MRQWVVDAWVFEKCNDFSSSICLDCTGFLSVILENGTLCVDVEGEIQKEYYRYIKPRTFLSRWWDKMVMDCTPMPGQIRLGESGWVGH